MEGKKIIYVVLPIMSVALIATAGLIDLAEKYDNQCDEIQVLKERLKIAEEKVEADSHILADVELLKYQDKVLKKRYPVFAKIVRAVHKKSRDYGFEPNLIMSLIHVESSFRPYAVSSHGAYGLMQINYSVWKKELDIDYRRIFEIEYNIDLGLKVLKRYYKLTKGNILQALHLYNNGFQYQNHKYKHKVLNTIYY